MNANRAPNTKTIVAMSVGAVAALVIAVYAIMSTLNATGTSPSGAAKINPATTQASAAGANVPGAERQNEATMAIHADPFAPLTVNPQSSAAADTRAMMDPNAGARAPMPGGFSSGGQSAALPAPGNQFPAGSQGQVTNPGLQGMSAAGMQSGAVPGSNGGVMRTRPMQGPGGVQIVPGPGGNPLPAGSQQTPATQKNPFGETAKAAPPTPQVIVEGSMIRGPAPKVNGWVQTYSDQPAVGRGSSRPFRSSRAGSIGNPGLQNPFESANYSSPAASNGSVMPMEIEPQSIEPPALVGTMLGQHPSAVFKSTRGVRVVELGDTVAGWKVVKIAHGKAIMKMAGRQVSLHLIGKGAAGMIVRARDNYNGPFAHKVRHYLPQQSAAADADTGWIYQQDDAADGDASNPFGSPVPATPAQNSPSGSSDAERSPAGEAAKQPAPVTSGSPTEEEKPNSSDGQKSAPSDSPAKPGSPGKGLRIP